MPRNFRFTVEGRPRTKGSMKPVRNQRTGRTMLIEDHASSKPWRTAIVRAARAAMATGRQSATALGTPVATASVSVTAMFFFEREIAADARAFKDSHAQHFPTAKEFGDIDKLLRNLFDALVDARVIDDDRRIVEVHTKKEFADIGKPPRMDVLLEWHDDTEVWSITDSFSEAS